MCRTYVADIRALCGDGYQYKGGVFKVATLDHWEVTATGSEAMEEIRQAPDDVLSFIDSANRVRCFPFSSILSYLPLCDPKARN